MNEHRIHTLRRRHGELEARLRDELRRPVPDGLAVREIKRRKLRLKDAISHRAPARSGMGTDTL